MQQMKGVSISQGLAVGKIVVLTSAAAPEAQAGTPEEELARFQRAQRQAVRDLGALYEKARAELGEAEAEIFSVHQLMAEDEDFADLIAAAIADGAEASEAVRQAGEQCAAMFSSMDDAYMRERAAYVQDVAARIRRILRGEAETTLAGPCLIAAEELTPSQTVQFPRAFVQGFLTARGAANSHTGILARTLGVPAVSQLPVDAQLQGRTAILNGDEGTLILDPDEDQLRAAEAGIRARQAQREALQQLAKLPSVTKDGHAIRLCLTRPVLLQTQLCAILRASAFGNVGVMFPMVTGPAELAQLKAALRDAEDTLCARGERFGRYQTGVMIETPAAVFMSRELAREVDFFSIGTNDLTQYLLAMDRQNPVLAPFCDPHHPAVLRAIEETVRNAHLEGCRVGICGELAADESLTQTFLRLGVDELSVSPPRILPLRRAIRDMTLA